MLDNRTIEMLDEWLEGTRKLTFLVGAGLSAESGIPTFRGQDGFWTVGSRNETPQSMGTKRMFNVNADEVWRWYLYRFSLCSQAQPNDGHKALSRIERLIGDRFALISQNVDGLHFRKESKISSLYLIHGDLRYMRCSEECSKELYPIPDALFKKVRTRDTPLLGEEKDLLICPKCGEYARPHVLWFDEYYDERNYFLDTTQRIAKMTGLMIVVGTSGATTLPQVLVDRTLSRNGLVLDINPNPNQISDKVENKKSGHVLRANSSLALTLICDYLEENYKEVQHTT